MRKLLKIVVFACFIGVSTYLAVSGILGNQTVSAALLPAAQDDEKVCQCPDAKENPLPPPTSLSPDAFHDKLLAFLESQEYANLKWCEDKRVRDTGPWINGMSYGVHPSVKIYYSPGIINWLVGGRLGDIPDGAMIVKEMYDSPAARWEGQTLKPASWTVMIKDSKGSKDGWYWGGLWTSNPPMPKPSDSYKPPFSVLNEGFSLACIHCHSSAEKEMTFATLNNIKGFRGNPVTYFVDDSWRPSATSAAAVQMEQTDDPSHTKHYQTARLPLTKLVDAQFYKLLGTGPRVAENAVRIMPAETYDHVWAGAKGVEMFLTSDNCQWCHSGNAWYGKKFYMILEGGSKNPVNVSPYGEWRWSPMGLAGRDPIFYAQLDSEIAYLRREKTEKEVEQVVNLCLSCHGVMGKRQLNLDHNYLGNSGSGNPKEPDFKLDFVYNTNLNDPNFKYGALARDGVSCASCHHIVRDKTPPGEDSLQYFLKNSITGQFKTGNADELYGPFKNENITPYPMKQSLGVTPKHDEYIRDSRMCGSCHTIDLPVMDGKPGQMHLEQSTYLEWLNSQFQTEFNPGANAKSCQDCHMAGSYANRKNNVNIPQINSVVADIQDQAYPMSENRASEKDVFVRYRTGNVAKGEEGFARHQLQGLNVFLLEMFNQFMARDSSTPPNYSNEILGVRKSDYMSTLNNDLDNAIANFVQQAENDTATIEFAPPKVVNRELAVDVKITNKTGHRLPSGVGFRRVFVELLVMDASNGKENILWSSGRTNELGFIVDKEGRILDSEYVGTNTANGGKSQPHYYDADNRRIRRSDQVQIFEELVKDANGKFTTSFLRIDEEFKDNRLLPIGWSAKGPSPSLTGRYLEITFPKGDAAKDPNYLNGSGTSIVPYRIPVSELRGVDSSKLTVKATLYYQAIPPYYLMQRFEQAPNGDGTRRLYYLTSNLNLRNTPIKDWKLPLVSFSLPAVRR